MPTLTAFDKGAKSWSWHFLSVYPITMTLGFVLAFLTVAYFWKRQKYDWESLQIILIVVVPSSILGARTWYLLFPPEGITADWGNFFQFQGLAIQGGVMAAFVSSSTAMYFMRHSIDYRTVLSAALPAVLIGQAIGRWGNFANHEVFGAAVGGSVSDVGSVYGNWVITTLADGSHKYTIDATPDLIQKLGGSSLNWLTFIKSDMLINVGGQIAYRQPFFFYESMLNLLGYFVLAWTVFRKNWFKPGVTGGLYFMWYGLTRIIMEPLRDNSDIMRAGNISLSTLFSGLWMLFGFSLVMWFQGFTKPFDKWFIYLTKKVRLYNFLNKKITKSYKLIKPVKPRKIAFFGEKVEYVHKWLWFFGPKKKNIVRIWLPQNEIGWSKREINQGHRNKK